MHIRKATTADIDEIGALYKDTILSINSKDYSKEQINAWASTYNNQDGWIRRIEEQHFYLAEIDGKTVGFASVDNNGYLDLLYVHKDHQNQGIATHLMKAIEKVAKEMDFTEITVQAGITSVPFFNSQGFVETGKKKKVVNGVTFTNTLLTKKIK